MRNKRTSPSTKTKSRQNRGFVIASGICIMAIGVAAWAAYDSVVQEPLELDSQVSISETQPAEEESSSLPSPTPTPDQAVAGSVAPSPSAEPTPTPTPAPASEAEADSPDVQLDFPVGQKILKRFSADAPVYSETMRDWRVHNGVDFEAAAGESVKAMGEGTVQEILKDASLGNVVVISHGELEARYCGLADQIQVKKGDAVASGQEIGTVGTCPAESAEKSHFHLEIRQDEEWVDPLSLLMTEEEE